MTSAHSRLSDRLRAGSSLALAALLTILSASSGCGRASGDSAPPSEETVEDSAVALLQKGREIFRYDTFGDEVFWGERLRLHEAIKGQALGGVGPGLSAEAALSLGLKVDVEALPGQLQADLRQGRVDLGAPATTLELLRQNAVVGVTGIFDASGDLASMGIQCALCHSTVDDSFDEGIGKRLDGWPARDLDVGAIIALAPDVSHFSDLLGVDDDTVRDVLRSWGPGKFDAHLLLDGKATRPDGGSAAVLIPPAFGLLGVNLHTSTGWGSVTHWNAFVANLEMGGQGTFIDRRLEDGVRFPIAAMNGFSEIRHQPDLVTSKLPALQFYQLALSAPRPPAGSFDPEAATRGEAIFNGRAQCASCHVPPIFTEPGWNLHTPEEIGIDDFQAQRSPEVAYRTTPLAGLFTRRNGGFYHDGRFPTLSAVVDHYDTTFTLGLTPEEKADLIEYLKSL